MSSNMLIPYLKNVNSNLKRKMNPIGSFSIFDMRFTCCRININIINLRTIKFDRNIVFSLDKWIHSLYLVALNKINSITDQCISFPTPYFEDQNLIDLFCILLFLVDWFLSDNRPLNVNFRQELFNSYLEFLTDTQTELFYQILILTNNSCEILNDVKLFPELFNRLNLFEFKNNYGASFFIPIHNTLIEKWSPLKRINHFQFTFLKQDSGCFYVSKDNKNFNYHCIPDFVFGLSDAHSGRISIFLHNGIEFFQSNNESLMEWFNDGISLDITRQKNFSMHFPVDNSIGMQDFMILLEIWILLRKTFKYRTRVYCSLKEFSATSAARPTVAWPFSGRIFTFYYFTYLYVFYFTTKSNRQKTFKYSWSKMLQHEKISIFEIDNSLVELFKFPGKFKIDSIKETPNSLILLNNIK